MVRSRRLALLALVLTSLVLSGAPAAHAVPQPTLQSTTPSSGVSVQAAPEISATYDVNLAATSTIDLSDSSGDPIAGTGSVSGRTVRFSPTEPITEDGSPYSATATVRDSVSNLSTVTVWTFSVDVTRPAAPSIGSVEGDVASPSVGMDATPTIVVSGVTSGDTVTILEGATPRGSKVVPAGATSVTLNAAEADADVILTGEGDHTLAATARDAAGNVSNASSPFVYRLDTSAPASPAIVSVEDDASTPAAGNDLTPTIVVSGVTPGDTVSIREGQAMKGSKVVPAGADAVTFNATESGTDVSLTNGDHTLTAVATDVAGNTSTPSAGFVYTLDNTSPAAPTIASVVGDTARRRPATTPPRPSS